MKAAVLAVLLAAPAAALEPSWEVSGATSALVGAETFLAYKPSVPSGAKLEADPLSSATTDFAVVKAESRPDGTWAWTVLPLNEGRLSFTARWLLDGRAVAAPPVPLAAVTPGIPKDADIVDIKEPISARRALWPWLLAAVLGALSWEAWRRWKARPRALGSPDFPSEPPLAPEDAAEKALAELAASGLWERGEHAAYYLRLTDILRAYLEARYGEPATAMTSPEVARLVQTKAPDLKASALAREVLSRADLVKFARIKPGAEEGPRDAAQVLAVVRATTPAPTLPAEAAR